MKTFYDQLKQDIQYDYPLQTTDPLEQPYSNTGFQVQVKTMQDQPEYPDPVQTQYSR